MRHEVRVDVDGAHRVGAYSTTSNASARSQWNRNLGELAEHKRARILDTERSSSCSNPSATSGSSAETASRGVPESPYAWTRLAAALLLSGIGGVGMWSVIVALPAIQAEFGVARSAASLPYTVTMICFGLGGIAMGRLSDRFGIVTSVVGRGRLPRARVCPGQPGDEPLAVRPRPGPARGGRQLGHVRPGDRRYLALVHPPSRHGRGHHRERQLPRRRRVAAGGPALHPDAWGGATPTSASPPSAWRRCCRSRWPCAGGPRWSRPRPGTSHVGARGLAAPRHVARRAADGADHRRR